jgi:N,N-dimethylformamidase beta subunit-like, C-terminal
MSPRHFTRWPAAEGYASRQSVVAGDPVDLHCSSRVPSIDVEVARLGDAREVVWRTTASVGDHPVRDDAWHAGCDWPVALTIPTDATWRPGLYEIELRTGDGPQDVSQAFVVVRHPGRDRPTTLLHLATNTWQAYNQWGGKCLYSGATEVSFRRPLEIGYITRPVDDDGYDLRVANIGEYDPEHHRFAQYLAEHEIPLWTGSAGWFNWERRLAEWADWEGIELDYAVDADLEADPSVLDGRRLLLTAGHNEYWSWGMRDSVDQFVDAGGNWAILSGNTSFWQVRYSAGHESMICFKAGARTADPVRDTDLQHTLTSCWADPLIGRPETQTIGLSFTRGGYYLVGEAVPRGTGGYTIQRPDHWAFAGTDLRYGDEVGAAATVVGYEVDGCALELADGMPRPTGEDGAPDTLEVLAVAPAHLISITDDHCEAPASMWASADPPGDLEFVAATLFGDASPENVARLTNGHAVMAVFTHGEGTVFNAGSANWCYGLGADPLVERITRNVVERLG